jgi:hypothetical protein
MNYIYIMRERVKLPFLVQMEKYDDLWWWTFFFVRYSLSLYVSLKHSLIISKLPPKNTNKTCFLMFPRFFPWFSPVFPTSFRSQGDPGLLRGAAGHGAAGPCEGRCLVAACELRPAEGNSEKGPVWYPIILVTLWWTNIAMENGYL